jgi:hypothetical protein
VRCRHCSAETDPNLVHCENCHLDRQAPLLQPGVKVYPMRGVGLAATIAVGVVSLVTLVMSFSPLLARELVMQAAETGDDALLASAYLVEGLVALIDVALLAAAGVLVIIWLWRARRNLDAFPEASCEYGAGWAIGSWFTPIVNFFIPCKMVYQVAAASLHRSRIKTVVGVWWGSLLLSYCANRSGLGDDPGFEADYPDIAAYFDGLLTYSLIGGFLTAVAGYCLGTLIFTVSRAQAERIERGQHAQVPVVMPAAGSGTIGV